MSADRQTTPRSLSNERGNLGEQKLIRLEIWLYGPLARHAGEECHGSYAALQLDVPEGTRVHDVMERLGIPADEKGITFINAQLTDMPGLGADAERVLNDGDRIGVFHSKSMWPFQYRHGASTSAELKEALLRRQDGALHHSTTSDKT
jgi:putative ubiquitin-RnfH superfamily antitoxin RatB of RatAB toxin-antitoxin module